MPSRFWTGGRVAGWHREDIKAALRKRHGSIANLAACWGVDASTISTVLRRPGSSRIEKLIADAIGQAPHKLWPHRWTPDGVPLSARTSTVATRKLAETHNETNRAA
jgi:Ner family transcriptional regulator